MARTPPNLRPSFGSAVATGFVIMAAVMFALPFSQLLDKISQRQEVRIEVSEYRPPEAPDLPPPPEVEEEEEEIEEIKREFQPITLTQLDVALNPDVSGFSSGDYSVPSIDIGQEISELIFDLKDLTKRPQPISQAEPQTPTEFRGRSDGHWVNVRFRIRADGTVTDVVAVASSNPAFEEPTIRTIRTWRFTSPEKDGAKVSVRIAQKIEFSD